jgi:adenosylcobinamide-GDP ribazoletransferase
MKRGDIGPMGAVALIVVLSAQAVAFGAVVDGLRGAITAGLVVCCSRAVLPVACRRGVPAARMNGLGVAVLGSVPPAVAWAVWLSAQGVLVAATSLSGRWWLGLVGGMLSIIAVLILVRRAVRRLGGGTGDVLGAAVEIALTIMIGCVAA